MKRLASMSWYIVTVVLLVACDGGPTDAPVYNQLASHASPRSAAILGWHGIFSVVGNDLPVTSWRRSVLTVVRDAGERGVYVGEFSGTSTEGYPIDNPRNRAPTCGIGGVYNPNDIAVDGVGDLIIPAGSNNTIKIFKGPAMCGPEVGSIGDPYGQPVDATSPNALIKTIAVANIFDTSGGGSISLCTMAGGCTKNLTNLEMNEVAAVAMDNSGNCWGSAYDRYGKATLTYFASCDGPGVTAAGYKNVNYGGLDIDAHGNIVSVSMFDGKVYVYSGCRPACKLVGGPFTLHAQTSYGHLNRDSTKYVAADFSNGQIDVYDYSPTAVTFRYSVSNGLSPLDGVTGAAYNPRSKQ